MICPEYLKNAKNIVRWAIDNDFKGYDPYDALDSKILSRLSFDNPFLKRIFIHLIRLCPINIRPLFGIKKQFNTTAMALFTLSFIELYKITGKKIYRDYALLTGRWLLDNAIVTSNGTGWGRTTEFQTATVTHGKGEPLTFLTALSGKTMVKLYEITQDIKYLETAKKACEWIISNSHVFRDNTGICFCYTSNPQSPRIFNASAMAASLLSMVDKYFEVKEYESTVNDLINYIVSGQREDGAWIYGYDYKNRPLVQIDFHQGFVLDCLLDIMEYSGNQEKVYNSVIKGAEFYMEKQFSGNGMAYWRFPKKMPVDIHNQTQGIITFSRLFKIDKKYKDFAQTILDWTIKNLSDGKGLFYYQRTSFFLNRTVFVRWSQAWSLFAIATFLMSKMRDCKD